MKSVLISIVVTTKNEACVIGRLFESIKKQTCKNLETIIVDNGSTDETKIIARSFTNKVYDKGPERSVQRNFGAKHAIGKYVFFLDADMELTPKVLEECVKVVSSGEISGVAIPEVSIAKNFWGKVKAYERSFYNEKGDLVTDAARFFSRKIFLLSGGYDETITGPEDWDLPENIIKLGFRIGRTKSVIYHQEKIISIFGLAKKKYYYALNTHRYLRKHSIPPISPKTVFFLRPIFYKNWRKILQRPILSLCLIFMLTIELAAGGAGYIVGLLMNK